MQDPNDLYEFRRRELAAEQRRERWQDRLVWGAFLLAFAAGFFFGWLVFAK